MITVKEEFLADVKLRKAIALGGHEVVTLWLILKAYAARHGTDGFVPAEELEALCLGLLKRPSKAMRALVECGKVRPDGTRGAGLVDVVPHGWQLHDYLDHAVSGDELAERLSNDRARKQLQRARAKLRAALVERGATPEQAQALVRDLSREEVTRRLECMSRDMSRDMGGTNSVTNTGTSQRDPRASARARAHAHVRGPAQPSPAQPDPPGESSPTDLPGQSAEPAPQALSGVGSLTGAGHQARAHLLRLERSFARSPQAYPAEGFEPSEETRDLAARVGLDLEDERRKHRDYALKHGRVCLDWDADLRSWLDRGAAWKRKEAQREAERAARFGKPPGLEEHEDRTAKARADLERWRREFGVESVEVANG